MSFFKKITKEFEGLMSDDKKTEKPEKHGDDGKQRAFEQPGSQQQYTAPPDQYGGAHDSSYGAPSTGQYGAPPPPGFSGAPQGAPYGAPPSGQHGATLPPVPAVPSGWLALWDPTGQRWAYLELSKNQVIWNFPTYPSISQHGDHDTRGFGDGQGAHGGAYGGYDQYGPGDHGGSVKKEKDDKKKVLVGAAAGVAAGAIGGAVIADALDDSDDEHHRVVHGGYAPQGQYPPLQEPLPDETADGSSVSSSDKEEVEEARKEYEEAYEETYGSDD